VLPFVLKEYLKLLNTNCKFVILGRKNKMIYNPFKKEEFCNSARLQRKAVSLFMPLKSNFTLPGSSQRRAVLAAGAA